LNGKGEKKQPLVGGDFRIYKGNFINDILNDKNGEIEYANGNKYLGGVLNGKRQGIGKIITPEGGIQNDGNWFENDWIDANKNNPNAVPIFYNQSSIIVEVDFNGTKFPMVLDSGASTVVINKEIFYALVTLKQIKIKNKTDNSFEIANGDIVKGATYLIDKMKIGKYEIEDIQCSVLDNVNASNLLGLNALLAPSKSFSIDVETGELTF
jgi:clan AA aspartic protease (TIGR02281 family)